MREGGGVLRGGSGAMGDVGGVLCQGVVGEAAADDEELTAGDRSAKARWPSMIHCAS